MQQIDAETLKKLFPGASTSTLKRNSGASAPVVKAEVTIIDPPIYVNAPPKKPQKYRAQPTFVDGIRFASKREAQRYIVLAGEAAHGIIDDLQLQPEYPIVVNGVAICKYVADFRYITKDETIVIEDVKGFKTPVYRLKKKLFEACYTSLKITEVK